MLQPKNRLSIKITGILLGFFVAGTVAIVLILLDSSQFEGVAEEINDAGGQGWSQQAGPPSERHIGVQIAKENAARTGGECVITSGAGEGTAMLPCLPISPQEERQHG